MSLTSKQHCLPQVGAHTLKPIGANQENGLSNHTKTSVRNALDAK